MNQQNLSATSHFLNLFDDSTTTPSYRDTYEQRKKEEPRVLDAIAVALATSPEDTYAAALDKTESLTLVLARNNGEVTSQDREAAIELLQLCSTVNSASDLIPFLLRRGSSNIKTRINNFKITLGQFRNFLDRELSIYEPAQTLGEEFTQDFQKVLYRDDPLPNDFRLIPPVLFRLLQGLTDQINIMEGASAQNESTVIFFKVLTTAAHVASQSRFLVYMDSKDLSRDETSIVQGFNHGLREFAQYKIGMAAAIASMHRIGKDNIPPIHWANDSVPDIDDPSFPLPNCEGAIRCNLSQPMLKHTSIMNAVQNILPRLAMKWEHQMVYTYVHAEIRIILYFLKHDKRCSNPQLIGCSMPSCLSCKWWIDKFNSIFRTEWTVTSRTFDKPQPNWRIPSLPAVTDKRFESVNQIFLETVSARFLKVLNKMMPRVRLDKSLYVDEDYLKYIGS